MGGCEEAEEVQAGATPLITMTRCEEQLRLVTDYGAAVAAYYAAITRLEQGMISGSREIYAQLRWATEEARMQCETARKALDDHGKEHGCGRLTDRDPWRVSSSVGELG